MKFSLTVQCILVYTAIITIWAIPPPKWNLKYSANGTFYIPRAEIIEPFWTWFDLEANANRLDFYEGNTQIYIFPDKSEYGISFKVYPKLSERGCIRHEGTASKAIKIWNFLSNDVDYVFVGTEILKGSKSHRFTATVEGSPTIIKTLWVISNDEVINYPSHLLPSRYDVKILRDGIERDHYYFDFESYVVGEIPVDVFEVPIVCTENHKTPAETTDRDAIKSTESTLAATFKLYEYETGTLEADLPAQFDWRLYGAVTPVKQQRECNSGWAFAAAGVIEGAYFLKTGKQVHLAVQAFMDCSWSYSNEGCQHGSPTKALEWLNHVGKILTEVEYGPYLGIEGSCHAQRDYIGPKLISAIKTISNASVVQLKTALVKFGPIAISIDISPSSFNIYSNGVYYDPACKNDTNSLSHVALLVGYGTLQGEPYWLIKNSRGHAWGNDGYILISQRDNNCGVLTSPVYVTM